ncbi:hypothetical protein [Acinetobacter sp.]|uniref:hypothetical protein n=1 Tax=Acinetobacter sp. TaxID=472 RepID=UPI00388FB2E1
MSRNKHETFPFKTWTKDVEEAHCIDIESTGGLTWHLHDNMEFVPVIDGKVIPAFVGPIKPKSLRERHEEYFKHMQKMMMFLMRSPA